MDILRRGRLSSDASDEVREFTSSVDADTWIFEADIEVDKAHVTMLKEQGIISPEEADKILNALDKIKYDGSVLENLKNYDDVHIAIESKLIELVGEEIGGFMHTARSRNDEVATCIRLALREELTEIGKELNKLREVLLKLAEENTETLMPGFTHLQHAQPTTLAHYLIAHHDAFERDYERLISAKSRVNLSPLGSCALATTGFNINRKRTCELLKFEGLIENSIDAVSSRDFIVESVSVAVNIMINLSRLAEELILWSTSEFNFIELSDQYASTSSIMPQKKNPDVAELIRGKTGTVFGNLMSILTICKALPYSYNRDLQEVTPHLYNAIKTTRQSVRMASYIVSTLKVNRNKMRDSLDEGFITATELADTIVRATHIPFRTAHNIVGILARTMDNKKITLEEIDKVSREVIGKPLSSKGLTLEEIEGALDLFENVKRRKIIGGPAPEEVSRMIEHRYQGLGIRC
ncbi:MAG: argininosuccinate lyase [Methanosarcinales archaeon]